jgi:thiamine-monophosphate kinase
MQTLADIGEDALIRRLVAGVKLDASVIAGPGDDCAVVRGAGANELSLLKTDAIVEGVHFTAATPSRLVGRKALARVISDLAAMGGVPRHAMITLIAPPDTPVKRVVDIYAGLRAIAEQYGVNIVGGETSRGQQLTLSISMAGTVSARRWISRAAAKAGDILLVTGKLGGTLRGKHLRFEPRLKEGQWLAKKFPIHAMMDLSDGLAKDLPRLAAASGLEFEIRMESLPRARSCTAEQAWGDGEDYELLFAVPPRVVKRLVAEWRIAFPKLELTPIGALVQKAKSKVSLAGGWDHFERK